MEDNANDCSSSKSLVNYVCIKEEEEKASDSDYLKSCSSKAPRARHVTSKQKASKVSRKQITNCPHAEEQFYAKGMC